jgi:hypothetical protein
LGFVSEDAWLSTFVSPEPVLEFDFDLRCSDETIGYHEKGGKKRQPFRGTWNDPDIVK